MLYSIISTIEFAENERVIIRLLQDHNELSKAQISQLGKMSWSTVVKMINRLIEKGIVESAGTNRAISKPGKDEALYSLTREKPLSIGIDVGYDITHIILMNLRGEVLLGSSHETPQDATAAVLTSFLSDCLRVFLGRMGAHKECVVGVGIGLPGGVIPAWLRPDKGDNRLALQRNLSEGSGLPVLVEMNQRAYTNYLHWKGLVFPGEDFGFVSMRVGVGMGLVLNNEVFVGHQSIAAEIGHMKVCDDSSVCRCGGKGCLESLINPSVLFAQYEQRVLHRTPTHRPPFSAITRGLHELYSAAAAGNGSAATIIEDMARLLSKALSSCLLAVYVPNIVIGGYFGKDGGILLPILQKHLENDLLPRMTINLRYLPMETLPIAEGDALLALSAYLHQCGNGN